MAGLAGRFSVAALTTRSHSGQTGINVSSDGKAAVE